MDFDDSPEEAAFRAEVRALLAPHAREAMRYRGGHDLGALLAEQRAWQRTLFGLGWAVPGWPREYGGRGLTAGQRKIFGEELRRIGSMLTGGLDMLGPTSCSPRSPRARRSRRSRPWTRPARRAQTRSRASPVRAA
jgi:alkylation response protein AidB-like acyl-CoA dehydrogenase